MFERPSVTSSGLELQSYPVMPMSLASSLFAVLYRAAFTPMPAMPT